MTNNMKWQAMGNLGLLNEKRAGGVTNRGSKSLWRRAECAATAATDCKATAAEAAIDVYK